MSYYIIDTKTNKINPNSITGEVALFKTEADYIAANNPNYKPATQTDLQKYAKDLLAHRLSKEKRTEIITTHKKNNTIDTTNRISIETYLQGQINEEIGVMEYMYVETTGSLLKEFTDNEKNIDNTKWSKTKQEWYDKCKAKLFSTRASMIEDYNSTALINEIELNNLSVARLIELFTTKNSTDDKFAKLSTINSMLYFEVEVKDIQKEYSKLLAKIKDGVHNNVNSNLAKLNILHNSAKIEQDFIDFYNTITPKLLDGDNVKDGKLTIIINDKKINIFETSTNKNITNDKNKIQELLNFKLI